MTKQQTYAFVSLGCPKNLVDSERMLGKLSQEGYALTPDADGADVVVVNTCGFIEPARQESLGVIREMLDLKRQGRVGAVVVAGCLAERKGDDLLDRSARASITSSASLAGRRSFRWSIARCTGATATNSNPSSAPLRSRPSRTRPACASRPGTIAYLKISEGCDRLCTFCAIPGMRGKHVTKPIEEVVREAQELAADGVRELIIVAQDTTYYGLDLYGEVRFAALLRELEQVEGIEWIRILYAYPDLLHRRIDRHAEQGEEGRALPRHAAAAHQRPRCSRRMQRRVNRDRDRGAAGQAAADRPGAGHANDVHRRLPGRDRGGIRGAVRFRPRNARSSGPGVFTYSLEPGTPAERLPEQLPEEVKQARRGRLMEIQQEVAFAHARAQVGKEMEVIVDGADPEVPGHMLARTYADAPDIDCVVRVKGKNLKPGDLVRGAHHRRRRLRPDGSGHPRALALAARRASESSPSLTRRAARQIVFLVLRT